MVHPLITLYPSTEIEFNTNGLGTLGEAVSCIVKEEANGSFELEMVYPISGRRYKEIVNRSIIFAKPNPFDPPQPFRIYEISRPMNGLITIYAAHISYDLSGYPIKAFTAGTPKDAMDGLKKNSINSHPFTFWTDLQPFDLGVPSDFISMTPRSTRSALGGVQGSILDIYGGEYKFDCFSVKLYTQRGHDRGVSIRYGKNLTDLTQEENVANVYTGVLPYWYHEEEDKITLVELPEYIVPTEDSYDFVNVYVLDLSSEFQNPPTNNELRNAAKTFIKNNNLGEPQIRLTVSFAQLEQTKEYECLSLLEKVELFDIVNVEFPEMNVSTKAKVCETSYDVLKNVYVSVTIGNEILHDISDTIFVQGERVAQEEKYSRTEIRKSTEISMNAVNSQTQMDIFNKLTNNGESQGIYIQNGLIHLNASYIKTGIIADEKGNNTWNLLTGAFVAKNITAYGSFRSGLPSVNTYTILNKNGRLERIRDGISVGYIDYDASGLQMQSKEVIKIFSPQISVANSSDTSAATTNGVTKTINQKIITSIEDNGDGTISWQTGTLNLSFINGLCTSVS